MATVTANEHTDRLASTASASPERRDIVVIGGGQAGLATGYYLARHGFDFVILDAHERIGDAWRTRWDSLTLFTPAIYSSLPGMPVPGPSFADPTKDEIASYLEDYASAMGLPVRTGTTVRRVISQGSGRWLVETDAGHIEAGNVVIATGGYQSPRIPEWADQLDPGILQLHSSDYRRPSQLQPGRVLIVGASHSGAEIAVEIARAHATILAGRDTGQVPFPTREWSKRLAGPLVWFMMNHILSLNTPLGRRASRQFRARGFPLERTRRSDIVGAGVKRITERVDGVRDGKPVLATGEALDVANVIWCTGFTGDYAWVDAMQCGDDGYPEQDRGAVVGAAGLYVVGLKFQSRATSSLIGGVGRDARSVADHIATRSRQAV